MSELAVEVVGTIVEGPIPEIETLSGGIHLVEYAGNISVLYAQDVHPSMLNLKPGDRILSKYVMSDERPRVSLYRGES